MNRSVLKNTLNIIFYTKFVLTNVISNNTKFHLSVLTVPNYRNILISFWLSYISFKKPILIKKELKIRSISYSKGIIVTFGSESIYEFLKIMRYLILNNRIDPTRSQFVSKNKSQTAELIVLSCDGSLPAFEKLVKFGVSTSQLGHSHVLRLEFLENKKRYTYRFISQQSNLEVY